jgi:hypothetical protein
MHGVVSMVVVGLVSAALVSAPSPVAPRADDPLPRGATTVAAAPAAGAPRRACGAEPTTAAGWQRLWDSQSGTWSGADGASSTRLPDGRLLWVFGDTFVGGVDASGRRAPGTRLVRNSMAVSDGACVDVVATTHDALPGRSGSWLWPTHSVVTGTTGASTRLVVFAQRLARTGAGPWGFRRTGTAVVSLTVPTGGVPVVGAVRDLPTSDVLWGAATVADGATTWVYGTRASSQRLVFGRDLLLARAPTATVGDVATWTYRTSDGWSSSASRAVVVRPARDGVSTVSSVVRVGSSYVVVTKPDEFLGTDVAALTSQHPWGPWVEHRLFDAPSTSTEPRYSPCVVAGRSGHAAVVVVSRTSTSLDLLARDAWRARPTFTDVRLPG